MIHLTFFDHPKTNPDTGLQNRPLTPFGQHPIAIDNNRSPFFGDPVFKRNLVAFNISFATENRRQHCARKAGIWRFAAY
ncbi:MAG: hypothetical protein OQK74_05105 [Gammaproteobacteria bacterium]|nr:hypothetical protein [Gammaproteobacteria bacterium]